MVTFLCTPMINRFPRNSWIGFGCFFMILVHFGNDFGMFCWWFWDVFVDDCGMCFCDFGVMSGLIWGRFVDDFGMFFLWFGGVFLKVITCLSESVRSIFRSDVRSKILIIAFESCLTTVFIYIYIYIYIYSWSLVCRPLEPVLGSKFHVYFESDLKHARFLQQEGKPLGKRKL